MSLRLQINLIIACLLALFASLLVGLQIDNTRRSVREEIEGATIVATQLLSRVHWVYASEGLEGMRQFLTQVGRIRANAVELYDAQNHLLYQSPQAQYKAGRRAPDWYAALVSPPMAAQDIQLPTGRLLLHPDPSRATLDGWDDLVPMLEAVLAGFVLVNLLVYVLVGRVTRPLQSVVRGLRKMEQGAYDTRLPPLSGREAQLISHAFNSMAQSVQDGLLAREQAQAATQALAENRELTQIIQARIEEVRGEIARELHDELGQQVTAIKSVGMAIARQSQALSQDGGIAQSARLVVDCADQIYDGMHRLIGQLRPLALDRFGLRDALLDMVDDWRARHPDIAFSLTLDADLNHLDANLSTAVYRITQEAVTNALRHAHASEISIRLHEAAGTLSLAICDDGQGAPDGFASPGHFGVIGMRERAHALGGQFQLTPRQPVGAQVHVSLPVNNTP